jgi:16S rRNA (adenine1518-N6/adenine1519-N6)-dimethyltransferase
MPDKITEIKHSLRAYGFRPKDYLGQNFLIDDDVLDAVIDAADLGKSDTVLEVGPGLGFLTHRLAGNAGKVLAVEKDRKLVPILRAQFATVKNVEIVEADILKFDLGSIAGSYKVVANIPYYLTSKIIQNLLTAKKQRIVAPPGTLSILGISVQFYADTEIVAHVPKDNFWPQPEVDSAIIRIEPKNKYKDVDQETFFRTVKMAFASKRKQLQNTLAAGLRTSKEQATSVLTKAGLDPDLRPQNLSIEDWIRLAKQTKK